MEHHVPRAPPGKESSAFPPATACAERDAPSLSILTGREPERKFQLAGKPEPSKKDRTEAENSQAIGGMRNPHASNKKIKGARRTGARIRKVLEGYLKVHKEALDLVDKILQGKAIEADLSLPDSVTSTL